MARRVKITSLPKAKHGLDFRKSGLQVRMSPGLGFNANQLNWPIMAGEFSAPDIETNSTLKAVPRSEANLEAEKGETAVTDLNGDGIPEHYKIGGKRHYDGGTPLYLPDDSFIFSRDRKMKIKDPEVLKQFGMAAKKGGYTPADIAKKYDINKFRAVLGDPDTDDLQKKSAEAMVTNFNMKLAKLALAQESIKGFPQGIPAIAMPYMEAAQIDPANFVKASPKDGEEPVVPQNQTEAQPEEEGEESVARYGMNIISQLQKRKLGGSGCTDCNQGGNVRKVKITFPKFQTGGTNTAAAPAATATVSKGVKYDKDADLYADPNWQSNVKSGRAYMKGEGGKYYRVTYAPPQPPKEAFDDNLGTYKDNYAYLYAEMADPGVQKALYDNYKKHISSVKDPKVRAALEKRSQEDVVSDFLKMQKHNYTLQAKNIDFRTDEWKNKNNPNGSAEKTYQKYITQAGLTPLNAVETATAQAAYAGFIDASKDPKSKALFKGMAPIMKGEADEKYLDSSAQVSAPDSVYGNTTAGELAHASGIQMGDEYKDDEVATDTPDDVTSEHLNTAAANKYTGYPAYWAQDVIKTAGAAADMARIKKYMPWQATPGMYLPDPTFYDPTRELAAGQESANALTQGLSAFTGPQGLSSRASSIQGQAAKQAADTLGRYANLNVGVADKFELTKVGILNQAAQQRAGLATQLYDKNTIANQTFDNSKAMARQNLRQSYIDALTNRANTYNLNSMFPQYAVDPTTGGMIDFTHGAGVTPEKDTTPDITTIYNKLLRDNPTMSAHPEVLWKAAMQQAGYKVDSTDAEEVLKQAGYKNNTQPSTQTTS